jgi:hypothetical protein
VNGKKNIGAIQLFLADQAKSANYMRLQNLQPIEISRKRRNESNADLARNRRQGMPVDAGAAAVVEAVAA